MSKPTFRITVIFLFLIALAGCAAVDKATTVATDVAVKAGTITKEQAESILISTAALS